MQLPEKLAGQSGRRVTAYRWVLDQSLSFIRDRGKVPRITDLSSETVQAWIGSMASENLALSTMR